MDFNPQVIVRSELVATPTGARGAVRLERRTGHRLRTVYRVAHIETANDNGLARVCNISDEGLGLRTHLPIMLGDPVTVRLTDDVVVTGRIVWSSGAECGVKLSDPIDSDLLLRELAVHSRSAGQRALRLPVNKPAVARSEQGIRSVTIQDVSQHGMKVGHDGGFYAGLPVKVLLSSGLERRGVVRWSRDKVAGLRLLEPFSADELGSVKSL